MRKYLFSLIALWFLALPAYALDGDCDFTAGTTSTTTAFANCALEIIEAQSRGVLATTATNSGNNITATSVNTPIAVLRDGTTISLDSPLTITGAAQVNLDGTGLKSVLNRDGSATASGDMVSATRYYLSYKLSNTSWYILGPKVVAATTTVAGIAELATTTEAGAQTSTTVVVTPQGLAFKPENICFAASDETANLTTGTAKTTLRLPYAFTLTAIRASLSTVATGASLLTVDVNEGGTTIISTKLTFDASESTTTTAATPAVISDSALADDAQMTVDIDQIGNTTPGRGLKVCLIGHQ